MEPVSSFPTAGRTGVPTLSATPIRTPPALPAAYRSASLNPLDVPQAYLRDTCQYLQDRWNSNKAAPGTIVMVVMLHSINKGKAESSDAISATDFDRMMNELHEQNFVAIDTRQLLDFLEDNAKIAPRAVLLIQDGRRYAENFRMNFRHYWEAWGWPVVNAWEIRGNTTEALWEQNRALEQAGWVDHQMSGIQINPATSEKFSEDYYRGELQKSMTAFQDQFSKTPIAIVWSGPFGVRPVQVARQVGYRLGFTANGRGPLMFNWIPLSDRSDNQRPSYIPEALTQDPLMTLPRYRPDQVHRALDNVRIMGKEAAAQAAQNKVVELEYYDIVCAPTYGAIP